MNIKTIGISAVAGIATTLAFLAAERLGAAGLPLLLLAAFPVSVSYTHLTLPTKA